MKPAAKDDTAQTVRRMKRISISQYDADHVYDWLRMYWRGEPKRFGGCYECERLGRRLERLIGRSAVRRP